MTQLERQDQSFPPRIRVRTSSEYKYIYEHGTKVVNPLIVAIATSGAETPAIGIVVSRKVGKAHERNRVKRLLRECYRRLTTAERHLRVVIIARPGAKVSSQEQLNRALKACLARCHGQIQSKMRSVESKATPDNKV